MQNHHNYYQMHINETLNETLNESHQLLKQAIFLSTDSEKIAIDTLNMLDEQMEDLNIINKSLAEIERNQEVSAVEIAKITGFWEYLKLMMCKIQRFSRNAMDSLKIIVDDKIVNSFIKNRLDINSPCSENTIYNNELVLINDSVSDISTGTELNHILSSTVTKEQRDLFDKNEELLKDVCLSLDRLSILAADMNKVLDEQNNMLDNLNNNVYNVDCSMNKLKRKARRIN